MIEGLEAVTVSALGRALDAASLRHQAISSNIANVNTVGYIPQRVNFEAQLEDVRRTLETRGRIDLFSLSHVRPFIEPSLDARGVPAKVQLDTEVADMAQNSVHFQALLKGIAKHHSILAAAIADGKK